MYWAAFLSYFLICSTAHTSWRVVSLLSVFVVFSTRISVLRKKCIFHIFLWKMVYLIYILRCTHISVCGCIAILAINQYITGCGTAFILNLKSKTICFKAIWYFWNVYFYTDKLSVLNLENLRSKIIQIIQTWKFAETYSLWIFPNISPLLLTSFSFISYLKQYNKAI